MNTQLYLSGSGLTTATTSASAPTALPGVQSWSFHDAGRDYREAEMANLARSLVASRDGRVVITIDGPASSGKSTQAENLARHLGLVYLDSGSLYRCIALSCIRAGITMEDPAAVSLVARSIPSRIEFAWIREADGAERQHTILNGEDVSERIRAADISAGARKVSSHPPVREIMNELQRKIGERGCATSGRAQGTEVFPDADVKIFLTASLEERARRRTAQSLKIPGESVDTNGPEYAKIFRELSDRDFGDSNRAVGKLELAAGMKEIPSSELSEREVLAVMMREVVIALSGTPEPVRRLHEPLSFPTIGYGDFVSVA